MANGKGGDKYGCRAADGIEKAVGISQACGGEDIRCRKCRGPQEAGKSYFWSLKIMWLLLLKERPLPRDAFLIGTVTFHHISIKRPLHH